MTSPFPPDIQNIITNYPEFTFKSGVRFTFHPPKTIILGPASTPNYTLLTLHELAHALLRHKQYTTHIQLLKLERAAWDHVREVLCPKFQIPFDSDLAEDHLDSYRHHLHQKSLCPTCGLTRPQSKDGTYHCPTPGCSSE